MAPNWKQQALAEIDSVKPRFVEKYGWELNTVVEEEQVFLYVLFRHKQFAEQIKMLRLTYGPEFPQQRPRESFVNPEDPEQEGREFWMRGHSAFKENNNPPAICLEGTWGFHHTLHPERDPLKANLNKLLVEIQLCFDQTS